MLLPCNSDRLLFICTYRHCGVTMKDSVRQGKSTARQRLVFVHCGLMPPASTSTSQEQTKGHHIAPWEGKDGFARRGSCSVAGQHRFSPRESYVKCSNRKSTARCQGCVSVCLPLAAGKRAETVQHELYSLVRAVSELGRQEPTLRGEFPGRSEAVAVTG